MELLIVRESFGGEPPVGKPLTEKPFVGELRIVAGRYHGLRRG